MSVRNAIVSSGHPPMGSSGFQWSFTDEDPHWADDRHDHWEERNPEGGFFQSAIDPALEDIRGTVSN